MFAHNPHPYECWNTFQFRMCCNKILKLKTVKRFKYNARSILNMFHYTGDAFKISTGTLSFLRAHYTYHGLR